MLGELRERYSLEVSSPGPTRPLSKPEHFTRFEGRRAKIRTSEPIAGQRSFTGTITGVAAGGVILDQGEPVTIPFDKVDRAHLAPTAEKPTRSN